MMAVLSRVMKRVRWSGWLLALVCVSACAAPPPARTTAAAPATSRAPATNLAAERVAFLKAYAAAKAGSSDRQTLAAGLRNYPLYPYLEATALEYNPSLATPAAVAAYLQRYDGMIPAEDLRRSFLYQLAGGGQWSDFLSFYRPGFGTTLACDALQARLALGGTLDFAHDLAALWDKPSLPGACTPALDRAYTHGLLTEERLLARVDNAALSGYPNTIRALARWLTPPDAIAANRLVQAINDPAGALQSAASWPDTAREREAAMIAIMRFARQDSAAAVAAWPQLQQHFHFDVGMTNEILAALALQRAYDFGADALALLAALPPAAQSDDTRAWRVRVAIAAQNWPAALDALDALSPAQKNKNEWRYFRARVLGKLGHAQQADAEFAELARSTGYYGFLAADQVDAPYAICPIAAASDPAAEQALLAQPGLDRAFELFSVGLLSYARREWDRALENAAPETRARAADLAWQRGWYSRPIFVFGHGRGLRHYRERFPLAYKQNVTAAAIDTGLDPAWIYALIRAESAWMPDAGSPAGAQGLMQLMPATASLVARRQNLPYPDSLFDPAANITLGTHYLANLSMRYNDSSWLASAAYNAGPGRVNQWLAARGNLAPDFFIATIPFHETRDYVSHVLEFSVIYDWRLHGNAVALSRRMPGYGAFDPPPSATTPRKAVACPPPPAPQTTAVTASHSPG